MCDESDHRSLIEVKKISAHLSTPIMRPPSPSIPEREFLLDAINQSLRLDGRGLWQARTPTLTFGPELGWVECSMGKTRYVSFLHPG